MTEVSGVSVSSVKETEAFMASTSAFGFRVAALVLVFQVGGCVASSPDVEAVDQVSSPLMAIVGLFPTGVDSTGALIGDGGVNPHYALSSDNPNFKGPNAYAVTPIAGAWTGNTATSQWISIQASTAGALGGVYTYTTTFTLTTGSPLLASISGGWACDDTCVLLLNNVTVATSAAEAYGAVARFDVPEGSPFQLGTNILAFQVTNSGGGPTGLQVLSIAGTVACFADDQCPTNGFLQYPDARVRLQAQQRCRHPQHPRPQPRPRWGVFAARGCLRLRFGRLRTYQRRVRLRQWPRALHLRQRVPIGSVRSAGQAMRTASGRAMYDDCGVPRGQLRSWASARGSTPGCSLRTPAPPCLMLAPRSPTPADRLWIPGCPSSMRVRPDWMLRRRSPMRAHPDWMVRRPSPMRARPGSTPACRSPTAAHQGRMPADPRRTPEYLAGMAA